MAFIGCDAFSLSKQAMVMAIEAIGWKVYRESELILQASPYGIVGRLAQSIAVSSNRIEISFDQPSRGSAVCLVNYEAPRELFDSDVKTKVKIFNEIDVFWERVWHYANIRDLNAIRMDSFIRSCDQVSGNQMLFVVRVKRSIFGGRHVFCPACGDRLKVNEPVIEGHCDCPTCGRVFLLRC